MTDEMIPLTSNCLTNVAVDGETGVLSVDLPLGKASESIKLKVHADLIIGLTAYSALQSNNGSFKPIQYEIEPSA